MNMENKQKTQNINALIEAQKNSETLVEMGCFNAKHLAGEQYLVWLENGKEESHTFTFAEIDQRARALAVELQQKFNESGSEVDGLEAEQSAIIITQPGPNFPVAFFGCLYAGIAAVPVSPLKKRETSARIKPLIEDSGAQIVIADEISIAALNALSEEFTPPDILSIEGTDISLADEWQFPDIDGSTVAFIQYTSGSTGTPKGVVVNHKSLMSNQRMIAEAMDHSSETVYISWLPMFHDMGLIGNLLQTFYLGVRCVLMSPHAFVSHPVRWLEAISKYRGTTSGAPNFAYDLCVARTTQEQRESLDLSSWRVAFNGAEPIRAETLARFSNTFATSGFDAGTMYPCYGMAEGTLFISGSPIGEAPTTLLVDKNELNFDRISILEPDSDDLSNAATLVSSGIMYLDCDVRIVHPGVCKELDENQVGEIWVNSTSIASEYKNKTALSEETFRATIQGESQSKHFLRTGDLGFVHQDQLYVTGRSKDLIIIGGRNHYPQDIEFSVTRAHRALVGCQAAAFSIDFDSEEHLVVVLYINPQVLEQIEMADIVPLIKRMIAREHGISLHNLMITSSRLPLTSSGKIQRRKSKQMYLYGGFDVVFELTKEGAING